MKAIKYLTLLLLCLVVGCSPNTPDKPQHVSSGKVYSQLDIINFCATFKKANSYIENSNNYLGYAEVNSQWIDGFYKRWRLDAESKHLVWDSKFCCIYFSVLCIGDAGAEFLNDETDTHMQVQGIAMFMMEYVPEGSLGNDAHAIIMFLTERGPVYLDPQVGIVTLTKKEVASTFKLEIF